MFFNQNNRLIRVEEGVAVLGEYGYNGLGQRATKKVDGVLRVFHYDFDGNIIAESLPDGTVSIEYLYMGASRVAKVDNSTGKFYFYLNNYLGTPLLLTDDQNKVVWEGNYKPFGEAAVNPNSTGVVNFRLAGQYYDEETGLHYNYHRYYEPNTGRYLTPDPIGLVGGTNLYVYVENNPINSVDPNGKFAVSVPLAAVCAAGGCEAIAGALTGIGVGLGIATLSHHLPDIPSIPNEDEAEDILQDILQGNYPASALPMNSPNDDIYQGWDWWKDNVGEPDKCDDDRDYCEKVLEMCREECLDLFVNNPDKLPGTGRNLQARQRRCIRDCMERNGCSNF